MGAPRKPHWVLERVYRRGRPIGYRVLLCGANGEEVMRAMTIYNYKRDAHHAIGMAVAAADARIEEVDDGGRTT